MDNIDINASEQEIKKAIEESVVAEMMKADANHDGLLTLEEINDYGKAMG
jgi:Ca2+-binding EF-hand superfamily protein